MWNNIIGEHIRRTNRNLLWTALLTLLIIAGAGILSQRYLYNFFKGPFAISNPALAAITDPDSVRNYYVKVHGDATAPSGVTEVEQERSKYSNEVTRESTTAHFMIMRVGDRVLVVKAPNEEEKTDYTGALVKLPSEIQERLVSEVERQIPEAKGSFLPYMLDATNFRTGGYFGLIICVPLGLLALWNLLKARKRMGDMAAHPLASGLSRYGNPLDVASQIDMDMKMGTRPYGNARISRDWLLVPKTYNADLLKLDDLAWAYPKVTKHKAYGIITTSKTFAAILWNRDGKSVEIPGAEGNVQHLLADIGSQRPWIAVGFTKEFEQAWKSDRASVLAAIDERRRQIAAGTFDQSAPPAPAV